jgi:subtilisin family serine protease
MKTGQMAKLHYTLLLIFCSILGITKLNAQKFGFERVLLEQSMEPTVFCLPNNEINSKAILDAGIHLRFSSKNWLFITATPNWIAESKESGEITDFYFEFAPPMALADTARIWHNVNPVHNGDSPLPSSYTGKDVIIGIVDQGLDWTHPDFQDANGNTRVLRYWDHSFNGPNPAMPYGYGQLWDSTAINNGTCTSTEATTAHGTTVAGMAVGNGLANGTHKGMAPDANIIIVETNFNLPNWTLTIADAIEYIFAVADSMNMPAVVNLSLGSYFGSHDATDPAGERINDLLDEKPGRIVVCAAGNSGDKGKYHLHNAVTADTSFVWFLNNPTGQLGNNTIFFDLWSDQSEATWDYAFGADTPSPGFVFRGRTDFTAAQTALGGVLYDTLYNNGNRIATFEIYPELVGSNYHMQILAKIDSNSYLYRFETRGSGSYDLWSGSWLGFNNMLTNIPSPLDVPEIVNYAMPDTLQTIVSSWNCSDKVISVGVFRNKSAHWDNNGDLYVNNAVTPGALNPGSSKGPTRNGITKPDVAAAGDVTLTAAPLWILTNPAYNALIDSGGWHGRNGGTSMASPIVAGIAGLYLERCSYATYANFRDDLHSTAYTDAFTGGGLPNNAFGYGKPDAFALLQEQQLNSSTPSISLSGSELISTPDFGYHWILDGEFLDNSNAIAYSPIPPYGDYQVLTYNSDGCTSLSAPFTVTLGLNEQIPSRALIYPNPSTQYFHIDSDYSFHLLSIHDQMGRTIEFNTLGNNNFELIQKNSGIYFLNIERNDGNLEVLQLIIAQ